MEHLQLYSCGKAQLLLQVQGEEKPCADIPLSIPVQISTADNEDHKLFFFWKNEQTLQILVGESVHPMTSEHRISMIIVRTVHGCTYCQLAAGTLPQAVFSLNRKDFIDAYAVCSLHRLWSNEDDAFLFEETVCSAEFSNGCIG